MNKLLEKYLTEVYNRYPRYGRRGTQGWTIDNRSMGASGEKEDCPKCRGTGKVDGKKCPKCKGRGWFPVKDRD